MGNYSFTGLTAGGYRLREVGQFGWTQTTVNPSDVAVVSGTNSTGNDFGNRRLIPGIELKKLTHDVDADAMDDGPAIAPGQLVTWTYQVTNTGETNFTFTQVLIRDDAGTPGDLSDDFSTASGDITFQSVLAGDADNILEPGETWVYQASDVAQDLGGAPVGPLVTFDFSGNSALYGTAGNIRTFTAGGVSVRTSGFSRDKSSGGWSAAYLGSYSGGLGVTDSREGSGSGNSHTVDNSGRDNYVLFEFSETVVVDSAFLAYVVGDSDLTVWIGTVANAFNSHVTLSDSVIAGLGFTEVNFGGSSTRTADFNAGNVAGNVLIVAAKKGDADDNFKIEKVKFQQLQGGVYSNVGAVTAGGVGDFDVSHYVHPVYVDQECVDVTLTFAGNSSTNGTKGNILKYAQDGVSVNVSAFSRTTAGAWNTAYLGAYSEGLGVTEGSEDGSYGTHRTDNVGRWNFVLFEFSTLVEIDRAFLDSVVTDSDVSIWIGTADNPFHKHLTLSDSLVGIVDHYETNNTESSGDRWADFNAGGVVGNVLVIAASVTDDTPDDKFKIWLEFAATA